MTNSIAPVANTPLQSWHAVHGARFADYDGWRLAADYSTVSGASGAGTGLALVDISASAKASLRGKQVASLARSLFGEEARTGKVFALAGANIGWACCLSPDHLLLLSATTQNTIEGLMHALPGCHAGMVYDVTSGMAGIGLIGAGHENVLRQLTSMDVGPASLPPGSCAETGLAGVPALLVRTPDSLTFVRIYVAWDLAEWVWERLWELGRGDGIVPLGMEGLTALAAGK